MRPVLVEPPSPDREPPASASSEPAAGCASGKCGECGLAGAEATTSRIEAAGWGGGRHALLAGVVFVLPLPLTAAGALFGSTPLQQLLGAAAGLAIGVALARVVSSLLSAGTSPDTSQSTEKR
ncbi:MAG TPA: hypothetical protein ENK10_06630 [Acidobacteria bacterium]|nr:hypothetical protein [Acidobacteriota bacterium]